jgi:hypothetical protein
MVGDVQTIFSGNASLGDKLWAGADLFMNVALDASMLIFGVRDKPVSF